MPCPRSHREPLARASQHPNPPLRLTLVYNASETDTQSETIRVVSERHEKGISEYEMGQFIHAKGDHWAKGWRWTWGSGEIKVTQAGGLEAVCPRALRRRVTWALPGRS